VPGSGWRVDLARRLRELPSDVLDGLVAPSAYTSRRALTGLETPRNHTHHLLLRDGATTLAYVPVFVLDPAHTNGYDPRTLFGPAGPERFVSVGAAGGYANHLMFAPAADRVAAAGALLCRAVELADEAGVAAVLLPHLDPGQAAAFDGGELADRPRHREPRGVLELPWTSFDGYLESLHRKRRASIRQERRAFEPVRGGLVEQPLAPNCDRLAPLLAEVERKYGNESVVEHVAWYLRTISRAMGDDGVALVLERGGRPVACTVLWQHPDEWHVRAWGCDYTATGDHAEYANVMFYEPIERAIRRGVPVLHFGTGSMRAKTLRGARSEDLVSVLVRPG
jgi:predicted N-acyltransferase